MAQTHTRLLVHAVFSTKDRVGFIKPEVESRLYEYMGGICRNLNSPLLAANGTANHCHLLISVAKTICVSDLMMHIKKDSSLWIKGKGPGLGKFGWQDGYGAFTIGESQRRTVAAYIARQKQRHATVSFEEEYLALLKKYEVEFDPRYIWS